VKRSALILGSVARIATGVARSLHRQGISVDVATFSSAETSPMSRSIRRFVRVPSPDDSSQAFESSVCELIRRGEYDLLIPGNDVALTAVVEHYDRLREIVKVACPPSAIMTRVLDKSITLEIAASCGLPVPETRIVSDSVEIAEAVEHLGFPFILKPARKSRSEDFKVLTVHSRDEIVKLFPNRQQFSPPLLAQKYCEGEGVGIEMLIHRRESVVSFQHRRLKELPYSGGVSVLAVAEELDPALVRSAVTLLRGLEWEGIAMVEFRVDPDGRAFLMEVNGRYWGTLSLAMSHGVDFPYYQWQLLHGDIPTAQVADSMGGRWRWTAGYIRRLHGLLIAARRSGEARAMLFRELRQWPKDFGEGTCDSLWTMSDPMPAVREIVSTIKDLAVSDIRALFGGSSRGTAGSHESGNARNQR